MIDPGIGFGKSGAQNFEILRNLHRLASLGYPILAGPSRKSFLRTTLAEIGVATGRKRLRIRGTTGRELPEELLFGTAAAVAAAVLNGAHIVRVHDVREMLAVVRIADQMVELAVKS